MNGYPVGVMANNPKHKGSTTDVAAGDTLVRLMQPCDTRALRCEFVEDAQSVLQTQLGPPPLPYRP